MIIIQWLGTAGFRVRARGYTFLFDPHLSGPSGPTHKKSVLKMDKVRPDLIFVTHGHVDHAGDLPLIMRRSDAMVLCNGTVADRLLANAFNRERIILAENGTRYQHRDYAVQVFSAPHSGWDILGSIRGVFRVGPGISQGISYIDYMKRYPSGKCVSFQLSLPGCRIQHLGSLGASRKALQRIVKEGRPDVLLLPLQRHTRWRSKALEHVEILKPRIVIPHHHDDSFPPFSEALNIEPFLEAMARDFPKKRVVELRVMKSLKLRISPKGQSGGKVAQYPPGSQMP